MTIDATDAPVSGVPYPTRAYRQALQSLLGGADAFAGGLDYDTAQGVAGVDHLEVTAAAGPGLRVSVAAGSGFVRGTESVWQGVYPFVNTASVTIDLSDADGVNPRIDIVGVQVSDSNEGTTDPVDDGVEFAVIEGTPAGSPVDPTLPANFLPLARVTVAAGDTALSAGDLDDLRVVTPLGRIRCTSDTRPADPFVGMEIYETDTKATRTYDGSDWVPDGIRSFGTPGTALSGTAQDVDTDQTLFQAGSTVAVVTNLGAGPFIAVTFPVAFPHGVQSVVACLGDTANQGTGPTAVISVSKTGFVFSMPGATTSANGRCNWMAWGW